MHRPMAPFSFRLPFEGDLKGNHDPFQKEQGTRFLGNERKKRKDRGWTVCPKERQGPWMDRVDRGDRVFRSYPNLIRSPPTRTRANRFGVTEPSERPSRMQRNQAKDQVACDETTTCRSAKRTEICVDEHPCDDRSQTSSRCLHGIRVDVVKNPTTETRERKGPMASNAKDCTGSSSRRPR